MEQNRATEQAGTRTLACELLRKLTGCEDAVFREGQYEAIDALVVHHRRALVVQRTGWGKSAVYFIAALLQRRAGAGPALIVSPLLALMRNQVEAAGRAGVRAATINSSNVTDWEEIAEALEQDLLDVLLVSPERLVNPRFRDTQLPHLLARAGLVVIDEAHCISDWGHDFRPDYRRIRSLIRELPDRVPVLATTATANQRVVTDVAEQLAVGGHKVFTLRGALARDSLRLGVLELGSSARRLAWLVEHLGSLPGSGIVYCLTVANAEDTAAALAAAGHRVLPYTGRTDLPERVAAEQALLANKVKALVATSALGMGFDKPDLGFVVHLGAPSSPVTYYQQVGRAGRATEAADVLLLPGREDQEIWRYFATNAMPTRQRAASVLDALAASDVPLTVPALEARVELRRGALELLLKVLAVDGDVENRDGGGAATGGLDLRRGTLLAHRRRAGRGAAGHARIREPRAHPVPDGVPDGGAGRPALEALRALRHLHPAVVPHRGDGRGAGRGAVGAGAGGGGPRTAHPVAARAGSFHRRHGWRGRQGPDPAGGTRRTRPRRGPPDRPRPRQRVA